MTIEGEVSADDLKTIAALFGSRSIAAPETTKAPAPVKTLPAVDSKTKDLAAEETSGNGELTLEKVRARATEISKAGKKDAVKALVGKYNAASIPDMDAKHYTAFYNDINAL